MIAVTIDGYSLAAWVVLVTAIVLVIVIAARAVRRDRDVRLARFGVFVERERFDDDHIETAEWPKREEGQ